MAEEVDGPFNDLAKRIFTVERQATCFMTYSDLGVVALDRLVGKLRPLAADNTDFAADEQREFDGRPSNGDMQQYIVSVTSVDISEEAFLPEVPER